MIDIKITGLQQLETALQQAEREISDLRPFWQNWVVPFLRQEIRDIFQSVYPGRLYRTGRYFRSLTSDNIDNINIQTPDRIIYGTQVPYAQYLEPNYPVLSLVAFSGSLENDLATLAEQWLDDTIREINL